MADKDYYSIDKILNIMKMYHTNLSNLQEIKKGMSSVGVSQYGEQAALPHGNTISSVTENEALRQIEQTKILSEIITDMKYIQDRWHRITDEQEAIIFHLRLNGYSALDISQVVKVSETHVYRTLKQIAEKLSTG